MGKIKAVDLAKALGISKATVSLALNNRPGVSEQTRQEILELKSKLENGEVLPRTTKDARPAAKIIKIVFIINGCKIISNSGDLWTQSGMTIERKMKESGYSIGLSYFDETVDSREALYRECNDDSVAGVFVFATELYRRQKEILNDIHKPMIVFDSEYSVEKAPTATFNNFVGVLQIMEYLKGKNLHNIQYLAMDANISIFEERRRGFLYGLTEMGIPDGAARIVCLGKSTEEIQKTLEDYLDHHALPEAFIMENHFLAAACIWVLKKRGIRVPEDVSLIGIDELPPMLQTDFQLTALRIPHILQMLEAIKLLKYEIEEPDAPLYSIRMNCQLIEGNSVRGK